MTTIHNDDGTITLERQHGCARCGGDGHDNIVFKPLTYPIELKPGADAYTLTHWAMCPATDEPILLRVMREEEPDEAEAAAATDS